MADSESDGFGIQDDGYSLAGHSGPSIFPGTAQPRPKRLPAPVPGLNNAFFDNLALRMNRNARHGTLPWERGYAATVLGIATTPRWPHTDPPLKDLVLASNRAELHAAPVPVRTLPTNVSTTAFRRVKFLRHRESPDALRQRAIYKWRMFLESDLESSVVGQQLLALVESMAPDSELLELIANVFDPKKTGTLIKRIASLMAYLVWARSKAVFRPLLFDEQSVYAYVRSLMASNAAPTKASAFRQALVFFRYTLGSPSSDHAILSARIRGCCSRQYKKKRKLKQAEELKVRQLRIFESLTTRAPADEDRCASGFFTFLTMASSRSHDAMSAETGTVETEADGSCTITLGTSDSKTSTTEQLQTQLLPLIAFAPALLREENWINSWMEARERCGLKFGPGCAVLPALGSDGKFLSRAATSAELIMWMNELLRMGGDANPTVTTHSCKRTILIWAAKYGAPLEDRRLLGHHAHPTLKSVLTYSKEALAGPLALVWSMISEILAGTFDPESTAISRITKRLKTASQRTSTSAPSGQQAGSESAVAWAFDVNGGDEDLGVDFGEIDGANVDEPKLTLETITDDSSEDSSSSDSSSSDLSTSDLPECAVDDELLVSAGLESAAPVNAHYDNFETFQHKSSGILHYRNSADPTKLLCSRLYTSSYCRITAELKFEWPKCQQCVGKT